MGYWEEIFHISGFSLELIGVFITSGEYINFPLRQIPGVLISAIFGGSLARQASFVSKLTPQQSVQVLRGLAFILIGFILHIVPDVVMLIQQIKTAG